MAPLRQNSVPRRHHNVSRRQDNAPDRHRNVPRRHHMVRFVITTVFSIAKLAAAKMQQRANKPEKFRHGGRRLDRWRF